MSPQTAALHNQLHTAVGLGLATNLVDGGAGHVAAHNTIHGAVDLGLPTNITAGQGGHTAASASLTTWLGEATPGIRGIAGSQAPSAIPGYPQSGLVSVSPGATTIQDAITANGDGTKFQLQAGTYTITSRIEPKLGQEFWGASGVTIAKGAGAFNEGFASLAGRNNVKVMNIAFTAFSERAIDGTASGGTGWEVGYCDIDGQDTMTNGASAHWRHHNKIHHVRSDTVPSFEMVNGIIEDNELGPAIANPVGGGGNKLVGTKQVKVRHNYIHDMGPSNDHTGLWLDYNNQNAIIEWNLIEGCARGLWLEVNYWDDDLGAPGVFTNYIRYNLIRNNEMSGIELSGSSFTEVYQNTLSNNATIAGEAEINLGMSLAQQSGQNAELKQNHIRYNHITADTRRGAWVAVATDVSGYADYVSNAKDNTFDFNTYDFTDPTAANRFRWMDTNKTWAQWQALPQDVNGSAI